MIFGVPWTSLYLFCRAHSKHFLVVRRQVDDTGLSLSRAPPLLTRRRRPGCSRAAEPLLVASIKTRHSSSVLVATITPEVFISAMYRSYMSIEFEEDAPCTALPFGETKVFCDDLHSRKVHI